MTPEAADVRTVVRRVVAAMVHTGVRDDEGLLSSGLIDSLAVVQLIGRLEQELGISIPTDAVQPDDFDGVDTILATLDRLARR